MKARDYKENLRHKYIRVYNSEADYHKDVDAHNLEECAYCLLNKDNKTSKIEYQPSYRTTNDDNLRKMPYFTMDKITLWAGLKIIWGYFGWEENIFEFEGNEYLGGKCYKVKEMTALKTVPDLYQYTQLNNLLRDVTTVGSYEEQDFSTIKSASYLVNVSSTDKVIKIPKCYTELDCLIHTEGPLFRIYGVNTSFIGTELNINNLTDITGSNFPFYSPSINHPIKVNIDKVRKIDSKFWEYEKNYIRAHKTSSFPVIGKIQGFGNIHDIDSSTALVDMVCTVYTDCGLNITDSYLEFYSDSVITDKVFDIKASSVTININKPVVFNAKTTSSGIYCVISTELNNSIAKSVVISNLDLDLTANPYAILKIESLSGTVDINNLHVKAKSGGLNINHQYPKNPDVSGVTVNIDNTVLDLSSYNQVTALCGNVNIKNLTINNQKESSSYLEDILIIEELQTIGTVTINTDKSSVAIRTKERFDCYHNILFNNLQSVNVSQYGVKFSKTTKENTLYNNTFDEITIVFDDFRDIDFKYTDLNNSLNSVYLNGVNVIDGNCSIDIPDKIYTNLGINFSIDYSSGSYTRKIPIVDREMKVMLKGQMNTNLKKDLTMKWVVGELDSPVLAIEVTGTEGYQRKCIIDYNGASSYSTHAVASIKLSNLDSFKLYVEEGSKHNYIRVTGAISTVEELDLTDVFLIYSNNKEDVYIGLEAGLNSFTVTETAYKKLRLKHYMAYINYGRLCDELDFNIVKSTVLGNLDNPHLGRKNAYDPGNLNKLFINRKLYNKFTDSEKADINRCFRDVNINEYED